MSLSKKLLLHEDPLGLLSPERIAELREQAQIKVKAKLLKAAEDKFLEEEVKRLEREADPKPEYELRSIVIDCADHTDYIRVDNKYFYYGHRYDDVPKPLYDQLTEIMSRGHAHEREISIPTRRVHSLNRGNTRQGMLSGTGTQNGGAQF